MINDFWIVSMDDARVAAYDAVDLVFLNDEYCHFRSVFWDLHYHFKQDGFSFS